MNIKLDYILQRIMGFHGKTVNVSLKYLDSKNVSIERKLVDLGKFDDKVFFDLVRSNEQVNSALLIIQTGYGATTENVLKTECKNESSDTLIERVAKLEAKNIELETALKLLTVETIGTIKEQNNVLGSLLNRHDNLAQSVRGIKRHILQQLGL